MDYKHAGVDIEAGYKSVELMKEHVKKTLRPEVLTGLGGFSGLNISYRNGRNSPAPPARSINRCFLQKNEHKNGCEVILFFTAVFLS